MTATRHRAAALVAVFAILKADRQGRMGRIMGGAEASAVSSFRIRSRMRYTFAGRCHRTGSMRGRYDPWRRKPYTLTTWHGRHKGRAGTMPARSSRDIREYVEEYIDPNGTFREDVERGNVRDDNVRAVARE